MPRHILNVKKLIADRPPVTHEGARLNRDVPPRSGELSSLLCRIQQLKRYRHRPHPHLSKRIAFTMTEVNLLTMPNLLRYSPDHLLLLIIKDALLCWMRNWLISAGRRFEKALGSEHNLGMLTMRQCDRWSERSPLSLRTILIYL
jgi:hypothetical protein